jgi:predicted CoA-binding protein
VAHPNIIESEAELGEIVRGMRTVAVVGMKDESKADEAAHAIPRMMHERGLTLIPVNPKIRSTLGLRSLNAVGELDVAVDVMDVFRRPEAIPGIADRVLALPENLRPAVVWLQSGIRHDEAAQRLAEAGIKVVQDRCLGVYVSRYRR